MRNIRVLQTVINAIFSFIVFIIILRIILRFFGANPDAPFVYWIYQTSEPLLSPFENMFPTARGPRGFVIEASALFGLIAYLFLGYLIEDLLDNLETVKQSKSKSSKIE